MDKIRIYHLEDFKIMRDGIRSMLSRDPKIVFVGEADKGTQMLQDLKSLETDLIIMDIYLDSVHESAEPGAAELCRMVRDLYPHTRILVHSMFNNTDKIERMLQAGAIGFVSKRSGIEELITGIKTVSSDRHFLCEDTTHKIKNLKSFLAGTEPHLRGKEDLFSRRELEVLHLIAGGKSSREIADQLCITERTVETHRKNMTRKSTTRNTAELVAYAISNGIGRN